MGARIRELVTTRGVVACRPRPLIMGAALVLGLAVARRPWLLLTSVVLGLGLAPPIDSVSCLLFACPFAATTWPSSSTAFKTSRMCMCPRLPTGSNFNNAKWLSI